jgi:hypothetical protein
MDDNVIAQINEGTATQNTTETAQCLACGAKMIFKEGNNNVKIY